MANEMKGINQMEPQTHVLSVRNLTKSIVAYSLHLVTRYMHSFDESKSDPTIDSYKKKYTQIKRLYKCLLTLPSKNQLQYTQYHIGHSNQPTNRAPN